MKITIDLLDAFVLSKDGTNQAARVAQIRHQDRRSAPWKQVNMVVESDSPADLLAAAANYFRLKS